MFVAKANISRINIHSHYDSITLHSPLPLLGYAAQIIRSVRPPLLELLHEESLIICRVASCSGVIKDCKNKISFYNNCSHFRQTPKRVPLAHFITWPKK